MEMNLERLERSQAQFTVNLPAEEVDELLTKTARQISRQVKISGFRPGRAPVKMVEAKVGKDLLRAEALKDFLGRAFSYAVTEHQLSYMGDPHIDYDEEDLDWGQDFPLTITVDLLPEVELANYKGVVMEKRIPPVSEEMVQRQIDTYLHHYSQLIPSEKTQVEVGDHVQLNINGVEEDSGNSIANIKEYPIEIGRGLLEKELEEGIVGMNVGEEKIIRIECPEDFRDPNFAGKTLVYTVELLQIQEREYPELDDEFAKEVSGFETVALWKENLQEQIAQRLAHEAEAKLRQDLVAKVVEESTTDLPPFTLESYEKVTKATIELMLAQQGFAWEDYEKELAEDGQTSQEVVREAAEKRLKEELVLAAIADAEKLEPTAEALAAQVEKRRKDRQDEDEQESFIQVRQQLRLNLAREFIREEAQVEEVQEEKRGEEDEHTDTNGGGTE